MKITLIAAVAENRVIGLAGTLPWRLPQDLKRFKRLTLGHAVLMGRRTFESLAGPLPDRRMIVLTRRRGWRPQGAEVARSLDEALELAKRGGEQELFVIGGAAVFAEALPRADRMYLTLVHATVKGDTLFPEFDEAQWELVEEERHEADERHAYPFTFRTYERKR